MGDPFMVLTFFSKTESRIPVLGFFKGGKRYFGPRFTPFHCAGIALPPSQTELRSWTAGGSRPHEKLKSGFLLGSE